MSVVDLFGTYALSPSRTALAWARHEAATAAAAIVGVLTDCGVS